jgi:hypothetical protein
VGSFENLSALIHSLYIAFEISFAINPAICATYIIEGNTNIQVKFQYLVVFNKTGR